LDWKWSSYQSFSIVHREIFQLLFDDENNYQHLHQQNQSYFGEYENLETELT